MLDRWTSTTTTECYECLSSDFKLSGTTCYFVSTDTTTWSGAVTACQALSADLATIESATVDNAMVSLMQSDTWIGLNDPTASKVWEWSEDSAALGSYTN